MEIDQREKLENGPNNRFCQIENCVKESAKIRIKCRQNKVVLLNWNSSFWAVSEFISNWIMFANDMANCLCSSALECVGTKLTRYPIAVRNSFSLFCFMCSRLLWSSESHQKCFHMTLKNSFFFPSFTHHSDWLGRVHVSTRCRALFFAI